MNSITNIGFKVLNPGMLSLIQDQGRFGQHALGLTTGGPLDQLSFNWANRLCNNPVNTNALEVSYGGLRLKAYVDTQIAITGGDATVMINGKPLEIWRAHSIKTGDVLEFGIARQATRHYIAVNKGFHVKPMFGSCSTVTREKIGGLNGTALQTDDFLTCRKSNTKTSQWLLPEEYRPQYSGEVNLRVVLGYQQNALSPVTKRLFFNNEFRISEHCDRMGFRLTGPGINTRLDGITSEGICYGAIQITTDGQPIVLLNDRQTIGGYPKIGSVLSLDIPKLTQRLPGTKIHFEAITIDNAQYLLHLAHNRYQHTHPVLL